MLLGGELYNAPITSSPQNILDLGTGTGIWAMDISEKFPGAHVIGNDISPIQPNWVAPNIEFILEDFETEWQFERNHFDFIHARCLAGYVPVNNSLSQRK
jgi:methylase of polypeptide subunit release factors